MVRLGLYMQIHTIHPMWEMEEYAIILRVCVWFNPLHAPTMMEISANVIMIYWFRHSCIWYSIDIGASFCHVSRIKPVEILIP